MKPSVRIVIPAYNAEATLDETLKSIAAQSFTDWQCVIVDDKSTDGTAALAKRWQDTDSRFHLIEAPRNFGGPAGPRNLGIKSASEDYIAFLDSDDVWHPKKLETQLASMQSHEAVFSATGRVNFTGQIAFKAVETSLVTRWITIDKMLHKNRIATSSVVISTSLVRQFPFNENAEFRAIEDFDCWLKITTSGHPCLKISAPLLGYRFSQNQISGNKFSMALKFLHVLNAYCDKEGRPLGLKRFFYFLTYVSLSVFERIVWAFKPLG